MELGMRLTVVALEIKAEGKFLYPWRGVRGEVGWQDKSSAWVCSHHDRLRDVGHLNRSCTGLVGLEGHGLEAGLSLVIEVGLTSNLYDIDGPLLGELGDSSSVLEDLHNRLGSAVFDSEPLGSLLDCNSFL